MEKGSLSEGETQLILLRSYSKPNEARIPSEYGQKQFNNIFYDTEHLINWKIEVSDNGSDWDPVDERQNQTQLTKGTKTKYSIKTPKCARYLRLKQMGENSTGYYNLLIRNVKFGGIYKRL